MEGRHKKGKWKVPCQLTFFEGKKRKKKDKIKQKIKKKKMRKIKKLIAAFLQYLPIVVVLKMFLFVLAKLFVLIVASPIVSTVFVGTIFFVGRIILKLVLGNWK